jgi:hypothetical protein
VREKYMPIGDVNSSERGSGARDNDGKAPMHQIPAIYWKASWVSLGLLPEFLDPDPPRVSNDVLLASDIMTALCRLQNGNPSVECSPFAEVLQDPDHLEMAMDVFAFGEKKYALYNWTKGMPWSVPTACALRHVKAFLDGEENDPESGLPHLGHALCNIVMLDWYWRQYPEGDDRPSTRHSK